jgi:hypothetical protein
MRTFWLVFLDIRHSFAPPEREADWDGGERSVAKVSSVEV